MDMNRTNHCNLDVGTPYTLHHQRRVWRLSEAKAALCGVRLWLAGSLAVSLVRQRATLDPAFGGDFRREHVIACATP
jgi:hypothetical protein